MPKVGKSIKVDNKKAPDKMICQNINCKLAGKEQSNTAFYNTNSQLMPKYPVCKACVQKTINLSDMESVYKVLKDMDILFVKSIWDSVCEKTPNNPFGIYIRQMNSLPQYRGMSWRDSISLPQSNNNIQNLSEFVATDDIYEKWGFGYSADEYSYFEKKWNKLIDNYGEKTSLHIEGLKTYIRFRVKEEMATAKGDVKDAKDWAALASSAATAAKINVLQLSKSDISGGVELLPQLFEAVESKVGIISILPKLKEQPMDDADLIIWCIINYNRRLEDKSRIEYREIWNFYDEMLNEYFNNQGYTKDQIMIEKDKRNSIFRDLGKVYREPVYEEGE